MLVGLFAATLFLSAFLLFWCQPMAAKMVLPFLGGSASVWTACVLFFQTMLLAGYVYAHILARRTRLPLQFLVHGILMATALFFLPIGFSPEAARSAAQQPVLWILQHMLVSAGMPFLVISTSAPLLQSWLARTETKSSRDPYFLYAASNSGSLLAVLIYPLLIEPGMGVSVQSRVWTAGYALLLALVGAAAAVTWKHRREEFGGRQKGENEQILERQNLLTVPFFSPPFSTRLYWLAAAAVPSALMLAVTTHISTNVASLPLIWIVPLAIYLITFILAFARGRRISLATISEWAPLILLLLLPIVPDVAPSGARFNWLLIAGHLAILFFCAYLCHSALAARRPDPTHLTEFYFWIALGGALGGAFSSLVAPAIFDTVLEYPFLVAMVPLFRQSRGERPNWKDAFYPALLGGVFFANWYVLRRLRIDINTSIMAILPDIGFFVVVLFFRNRTLRFAAGFAVLLFGYVVTVPEIIEHGERIFVARDFFGVKKVLFDPNTNVRRLMHGDTLHGEESKDPVHSGEPRTYYHNTGPAGDVMQWIADRPQQHVGVVGLGAGTMAAYGDPDRHITFFDIDPQVETIARRLFTYIPRCGANCDIVIGDGRLSIGQLPDASLDILMLDAFNSDSIPAHLVSREAIRVYLAKLKPSGMLLFHVSNRYLNVAKLVSAVATDAGLAAIYRSDRDDLSPEKSGSDYVLVARRMSELDGVASKFGWTKLAAETEIPPWTDDYSNMLPLLKWR
jgi:hypothetical protein